MNTKPLAIISAALTLGACDKLPFSTSGEENATRVCEERLKSDLKSPSSYVRTWSSFTPADPMTKPELMEMWEANRQQAIKAGNDAEAFSNAYILKCMRAPKSRDCDGFQKIEDLPRPKTAFVLLEYEAVNAFNVALPGFFTCRMNLAENGEYADTYILTSTQVPDQIGRELKATAELSN